MRAYSAQGDVIESPDIDGFLNALNEDIIDLRVASASSNPASPQSFKALREHS